MDLMKFIGTSLFFLDCNIRDGKAHQHQGQGHFSQWYYRHYH